MMMMMMMITVMLMEMKMISGGLVDNGRDYGNDDDDYWCNQISRLLQSAPTWDDFNVESQT